MIQKEVRTFDISTPFSTSNVDQLSLGLDSDEEREDVNSLFIWESATGFGLFQSYLVLGNNGLFAQESTRKPDKWLEIMPVLRAPIG